MARFLIRVGSLIAGIFIGAFFIMSWNYFVPKGGPTGMVMGLGLAGIFYGCWHLGSILIRQHQDRMYIRSREALQRRQGD